MSLHAIGLNHKTAPVEVRERLAFAPDTLCAALRDLIGARRVKEAAILSTCNRTEVYFRGGDPAPVGRWLEAFHRLPESSLSPMCTRCRTTRRSRMRFASPADSIRWFWVSRRFSGR